MHSVLEGLNWRICSHIYFIGVPSALTPLSQGIGRTVRNKTDFLKYFEEWLQMSKVVIFASGDPNSIKKAHADLMVRVATYLASFRRWTTLGVLSKIFKNIPFNTPEDAERKKRELSRAIGETPDWESKSRRVSEAWELTREFFLSRVETERGMSNRNKARLTIMYIERVLLKEEPETFSDISENDVVKMLIAEDHAAAKKLESRTAEKIESGQDVVEAAREALNEIMDDDTPTPIVDDDDIIAKAIKMVRPKIVKPLQSFTLDSKSIDLINSHQVSSNKPMNDRVNGISALVGSRR